MLKQVFLLTLAVGGLVTPVRAQAPASAPASAHPPARARSNEAISTAPKAMPSDPGLIGVA